MAQQVQKTIDEILGEDNEWLCNKS
jgi:hypothetical protein